MAIKSTTMNDLPTVVARLKPVLDSAAPLEAVRFLLSYVIAHGNTTARLVEELAVIVGAVDFDDCTRAKIITAARNTLRSRNAREGLVTLLQYGNDELQTIRVTAVEENPASAPYAGLSDDQLCRSEMHYG